ncbi:MAG: nucleotide sugar dehydrogenase [Candidatus Woesearchaeota archaeon]
MKICVIGMGYMGLPTALLFARAKHEVIGFDIDKEKIDSLNKSTLPFEEKGLKKLYQDAKENFTATSELKEADVFLIAVPTPITKDKECDLSYVEKAAEALTEVIKENNLIILESTVKPRTTKDFLKPILDRSNKNFNLAYVSEKAIPGNTLHEMINNDRVVGGIDEKSKEMTRSLYSSFVKGNIHTTDCTTAEAVKLMENTFRDVNIALANEFLKLSKDIGINVWEAINLANNHPRVNIHNPGPGVGGHCIAIDPWFLVNENTPLIKTAREINDSMPKETADFIQKNSKGKNIALLGAAYKKNVDDERESPTKSVYDILKKRGYEIIIHDPYVKAKEKDINKTITWADTLVLMTDHDDYKNIQTDKPLIDTRNMFKKSILFGGK